MSDTTFQTVHIGWSPDYGLKATVKASKLGQGTLVCGCGAKFLPGNLGTAVKCCPSCLEKLLTEYLATEDGKAAMEKITKDRGEYLLRFAATSRGA